MTTGLLSMLSTWFCAGVLGSQIIWWYSKSIGPWFHNSTRCLCLRWIRKLVINGILHCPETYYDFFTCWSNLWFNGLIKMGYKMNVYLSNQIVISFKWRHFLMTPIFDFYSEVSVYCIDFITKITVLKELQFYSVKALKRLENNYINR